MKNLKTLEIGKNVKLTLIPESKFKTNLVSVYILRELDRKEVTKNALLPGILKSGCDKYKTLGQLTNREEELYGSYLNAGTSKRGEHQVLGFSILSVNEKYLDEKILGQCIEFLNEIINNPSTADEAKVEASNMKVSIVKNSDTELQIENLLLAKGYDEAIVFIDGDKANVVVNMEEIKQNDATKIFDIVSNQSGISRENIKLTNNR